MPRLDDVLSWLKRASPAAAATNPSMKLETAPPLANYPTNEDADYARKYGFGYGTGNEPFLNNEQARVLGRTIPHIVFDKGKPKKGEPLFIPDGTNSVWNDTPKQTLDGFMQGAINNPKNSGIVKGPEVAPVSDVLMRAALAANRSPISALGFDPDKTVIDSQSAGKMGSLGGAYLPIPNSTSDNMYVNLTTPDGSPVVHESTHRGFRKLRDTYPDQVGKILKDSYAPDEETIVRWLMNKRAGDPEGSQEWATTSNKERQQGVDAFTKHPLAKQRGKAIDDLEYLASEAIKNRRPGGPR